MAAVHLTLSQVRAAAACPRLTYFDAADARARGLQQVSVTRVWKAGRHETAACGVLFHAALDRFGRHAAADPAVVEAIAGAANRTELAQGLLNVIYHRYVDRDALFARSAERQQAFIDALRHYVRELADVAGYARTLGMPAGDVAEELFGDRLRRIDATFAVGPDGEAVHVQGTLDHAFFDRRGGRARLVDYKLTAADRPANDLFQVAIYALLHHVQHGSEVDAAVLYLHPARQLMVKAREQIHAERHYVYNLLASVREWLAYDEAARKGLKPPGDPIYCDICRWKDECIRRLGPKPEGWRLSDWNNSAADLDRLPTASGVGDGRHPA